MRNWNQNGSNSFQSLNFILTWRIMCYCGKLIFRSNWSILFTGSSPPIWLDWPVWMDVFFNQWTKVTKQQEIRNFNMLYYLTWTCGYQLVSQQSQTKLAFSEDLSWKSERNGRNYGERQSDSIWFPRRVAHLTICCRNQWISWVN